MGELLLCGLPTIDVEDWKSHVRYLKGPTDTFSKKHKVVRWFFECVEAMTDEDRARLLQFSTGTSHVPVEGFQALQSHDGKLCWFGLKPVDKETQYYPIAHTCFNRLDL